MESIIKCINLNILMYALGTIYYNIYTYQHIIICYLYCILYNIILVNTIYNITKDKTKISKKPIYNPMSTCVGIEPSIKHSHNKNYIFNIFLVSFIEMISISICFTYKINNIGYEIITFISKSFIFEIIFDFFHYWTHRLSHNKYLYYFHKIHHQHTTDISAFSTYHHDIFDLFFTNVIPMYLTSYICPLYEVQFFMFLIFKTFIEISGHLGVYIKNSSFIQCIWIPQLFGIELYARDHYIHHARFNYNYSKRFTLWDKIFGTYKLDDDIIKKETILFDKKSIIIENEYIRYGLFILFLGICYII